VREVVKLVEYTDRTYPLVTVVIPTRNRRRLLAEAIESVQRQKYPNWELIVVDDCSEDDTWAYLTSLKDHCIRAIRLDRHRERSAARNCGLAKARGEYILFLDDDDRLLADALLVLSDALRRCPEAVAAVGQRILFDEFGWRRLDRNPKRSFVKTVFDEVLLGWVAFQGCVLYRTSILHKCGGWDERLAGPEDQELWLRLSLWGPVVFVPCPVMENRIHAGQWRPKDIHSVEEKFRREFVEGLPSKLRSRAERVLRARQRLKLCSAAYVRGHYIEAVRHFWGALREVPHLAWSPLVGHSLLGLFFRAMAGSVLGPAYTLARKAWHALCPPKSSISPAVRDVSAKRQGHL